jgi:hypothetical protein
MLHCITAVGHTEAEIEVEALEECIPEEVALDHEQTLDRPVTHREFNPS